MDKIINMHVPKCAGTSLLILFNRWYQRHNIQVVNHNLPKNLQKTVTSGHFPYKDNYEYCKWVTFVRHPIDRLMSFYHYTTARGEQYNRNHWWNIIKNMSLEQWLESDVSKNQMTKQFAGLNPMDDLTASDIDRAYRNVGKFHFIGLQENFSMDVKRLAFQLGVGKTKTIPHLLSSKNDGVYSPKKDYGNKHDIVLYDYIKLLR